MRLSHPIATGLFTRVWRKRLVDYRGRRGTVIEVRGWKSALIDEAGGERANTTFCLEWWPLDWKHFTHPWPVHKWIWWKVKGKLEGIRKWWRRT